MCWNSFASCNNCVGNLWLFSKMRWITNGNNVRFLENIVHQIGSIFVRDGKIDYLSCSMERDAFFWKKSSKWAENRFNSDGRMLQKLRSCQWQHFAFEDMNESKTRKEIPQDWTKIKFREGGWSITEKYGTDFFAFVQMFWW